MNSVEIRRALRDMIPAPDAARYCGRVYTGIIDVIMNYYFATPFFNGEQAIAVFDRFIRTGVLDFRTEAAK